MVVDVVVFPLDSRVRKFGPMWRGLVCYLVLVYLICDRYDFSYPRGVMAFVESSAPFGAGYTFSYLCGGAVWFFIGVSPFCFTPSLLSGTNFRTRLSRVVVYCIISAQQMGTNFRTHIE